MGDLLPPGEPNGEPLGEPLGDCAGGLRAASSATVRRARSGSSCPAGVTSLMRSGWRAGGVLFPPNRTLRPPGVLVPADDCDASEAGVMGK